MFIAPREWQPAAEHAIPASIAAPDHAFDHAPLYRGLLCAQPEHGAVARTATFLRAELAIARVQACELPQAPQDLLLWMQAGCQTVRANYRGYLEQRQQGAPRRFFSNRAHALYFLRSVAPTKLVDGAWLYGLLRHNRNPRFAGLVRTYLEELGDGRSDKNHVALYRRLLARHGLDTVDGLPDALYRQGLIQLALGCNVERFLPEAIGFNLAYEQLPLHLLITAYELNELGLDPYYFTLHVTVDNSGTGHARQACQAVLDTLPQIEDGGAFWRRLREGSKLASAGLGTQQVIDGFDIEAEVLRILTAKSSAGSGAHSDYCRVAGRSINDWLSVPENMPQFVDALQQAGWIRLGEPVENSRFWKLLQGDHAEMFGVFSAYELQVLHDWIRGDAATDGRAFDEHPALPGATRRPAFRAMRRLTPDRAPERINGDAQYGLLDPDIALFQAQFESADEAGKSALLVHAMSPARHWTPVGLLATRMFASRL